MKNIRNEKGIALPLALFILTLIVISCTAYIKSMNNELYMQSNLADRITTKYVAEAGINHGLALYEDENNFPISGEATEVNGTYTVEYYDDNKLLSIGTYKDKTIKLIIELDDSGKIIDFHEEYSE